MSYELERMQQQHQLSAANSNNISGSNDPKRIAKDSTELLIRGAQAIADGRELGLTDDQTIDYVSRFINSGNEQ